MSYGVTRLPGIHSSKEASFRHLFTSEVGAVFMPGGEIVKGASSRDPLNTGYLWNLQCGMMMGKITSGGLWAPSVLGLVTADYTSGGTTLTVSPATAVEIVRRQGASGTFKLTHAPTATGTVVPAATVTYSAVNTGTGAITVTDIGANVETGAIVHPTDGSETFRGVLAKPDGLRVVDEYLADIDVPCPMIAVAGQIDTTQILNYPAAANTTLIAWWKAEMRKIGWWTFSDDQ